MSSPPVHPAIRLVPAAIGLAIAALLLTLAGGYGYHRDELYFRAAGLHPAFGYVDQPPLTPLLARAMYELFGDSLVGLRLPAAAALGLTVLVTGLIAGELGGTPGARALAAAATAVSGFPLAVGHMLSTATVDLLIWTTLCWLLIRALRDGGPVWLAAGAVVGIGLQNKWLVLTLLAAFTAAVLMTGPSTRLRSRWPWLGVLLALAVCAPNLLWQAAHGWPQLQMSALIAEGGTGFATPRWLFLPYQLVLFSPFLVPIWLAGLWLLLRDPALRTYRALGLTYLLLAAALLAVGGKMFYLAGLYPLLLAAGAQPTLRWVQRAGSGAQRGRQAVLASALVLSAALNAVLMLPVVPARYLAGTPIPAINANASESVGWPAFAATMSAAYRRLPVAERASTIVLAGNYGEAGAVDRFRGEFDLPAAYSGHNSYASWGPPPESADTVLAVGIPEAMLREWFGSLTPVARIDNGVGLANQEQRSTVWLCRGRRLPWADTWPRLAHLG